MEKIKIITILFAMIAVISCSGQSKKQQADTNNMTEKEKTESDYEDDYIDGMVKIINADYGICYTIGNYQLCPEKKMIKVVGMFGTAVKDCFGFFPDSTLKYDEVTMIIFAGHAFFDNSDFNIDWKTVKLLSCQDHHAVFTDGKILYHLQYGNVYTYRNEYDEKTYEHYKGEERIKHNLHGVKELTEMFCIKDDKFYCGSYVVDDSDDEGGYILNPILETFDVPNLRTIVSGSGFESNYITDGKQVIHGGGKGGFSFIRKDGEEYVLTKDWMIEGVDLPTVRVLGRDILIDKNNLYYGTETILS